MEIKLSPSILSADFANLERDIKIATDAGAEYVHVDVMDGHFVPNITIGAPVVKALRKATDKVLDVHLMITDPDQYLDDFIKAGSDIITVHYESNGDTLEQLKKIKAAGIKASCVIKPKTPVDVLFPLLPYCDMVLIMTVEPGFGGQGFIPECMDKIRAVRAEDVYKRQTRQDAMVFLKRTIDRTQLQLQTGSVSGFSDAGQVSGYAQEAVGALVNAGVIGGSNGRLSPRANVTRAEMAVMLYRATHLAEVSGRVLYQDRRDVVNVCIGAQSYCDVVIENYDPCLLYTSRTRHDTRHCRGLCPAHGGSRERVGRVLAARGCRRARGIGLGSVGCHAECERDRAQDEVAVPGKAVDELLCICLAARARKQQQRAGKAQRNGSGQPDAAPPPVMFPAPLHRRHLPAFAAIIRPSACEYDRKQANGQER